MSKIKDYLMDLENVSIDESELEKIRMEAEEFYINHPEDRENDLTW